MADRTLMLADRDAREVPQAAVWARTWPPGLLVAVVFLLFNVGVLRSFVRTWLGRDEYSHGFLVPLIALFFVWEERSRLARLIPEPSLALGLAIVAGGSSLSLIGLRGGAVVIQQTGLIVTLIGLVATLLGKTVLRTLALPLAYLFFMLPFLGEVGAAVHRPFQLVTAFLAEMLLHLVRVPVLRNQQFLELPKISLEVAEACSGIRYLVSIVAVAVPLSYFTQRAWWRRILLVVSGIVVGILANSVRVALIGIWVYYGNSQILHGPQHILQGLFVAVSGYAFLFLVAFKFSQRTPKAVTDDLGTTAGEGARHFSTARYRRAWMASLLFLAGTFAWARLSEPSPVSLDERLASLPRNVGDWRVIDGRNLQSIPGADRQVNLSFEKSSGQRLELTIGCFTVQREDQKMTNSALSRLVGSPREVTLRLPGGKTVRVNESSIENSDGESHHLWWYMQAGKVDTAKSAVFMRTALRGLLEGRTDGAFILITARQSRPAIPGDRTAAARDFAAGILPILQELFTRRGGA